jgi:ADP-ribose pyrophosphatase YjhB (NUDIX family)
MPLNRIALVAKITAQALLAPVAYGVCALIERDGKVLLVRHSYVAGWLLPGGGVGRGEPPEVAIIREMQEEIGLARCAAPELFGLYSRKAGWATNVIALYRLCDAEFTFKPNVEIREVQFADPVSPPEGTPRSVATRLKEFAGLQPRSPFW